MPTGHFVLEDIMENCTPLISVIVPVYKVEEYLCACIDSILAQTYENLEIILVDDGSPDNSGKICDEYAEKDSRIKVIHKENGGLSDARNAGLDVASGEYIAFIDSDDSVHPKMFDELYKNLADTNADISCCAYARCYSPDDRVPDDISNENRFEFSSEEALFAWAHRSHFGVQVWAKIYRFKTIESIRFDTSVRVSEDIPFLAEAIMNAKKIVYFTRPMYNYTQRTGSILHTKFNERNLTAYDAISKVAEFGESYSVSQRNKDSIQAAAVMQCIYMAYELISQKAPAKIFIPIIKKNTRRHISRRSLAQLHRSRRIQAILLSFSYTLFKLFFRLAKNKKSA